MSSLEGLRSRVKMDGKGRITIDEKTRRRLGLKQGSIFQLEVYGENKILVTVLIK